MMVERIPKHVAIIMDGNRRWAKKKGLLPWEGHRAAMKKGISLILAAQNLGIRFLTLFAWSTENWQRDPSEIEFIFDVLRQAFAQDFAALKKAGMKIQIFGEPSAFPPDIQQLIQGLVEETKNNRGMVLNLCLSYGGRAEIVRAIRKIIQAGHQIEEVNEELVSRYLDGGLKVPDPELVIRTSGEKRLSNFLTWQSIYSELIFLPILWPDFGPEELKKAIEEWKGRERRFGR